MYLDDWLILGSSKHQCLTHTESILSMCQRLGFSPNREKCDLTPSQNFSYLGMSFDTASWRVRPAPHRLERISSLLQALHSQSFAPARQLAALLGQMESLSSLIPLAG